MDESSFFIWRFESDLGVAPSLLDNTFVFSTVKCKCLPVDMLPIDLDFPDIFQFTDKGRQDI